MPKIISIHEYRLKPDIDPKQFENTLRQTGRSGLLQLPGLENYYFVKGIRGARQGEYAAVWFYESKEAWEKLWGPVGQPKKTEDYPEDWKVWEDQILAQYLLQDPDLVTFTAYEEL